MNTFERGFLIETCLSHIYMYIFYHFSPVYISIYVRSVMISLRHRVKHISDLQTNAWVRGGHIVQQLLGVFADEGLLVVACNIMPSNAIVVDVVKDG